MFYLSCYVALCLQVLSSDMENMTASTLDELQWYGCLKCQVVFASHFLFVSHPCCDRVREKVLQQQKTRRISEIHETVQRDRKQATENAVIPDKQQQRKIIRKKDNAQIQQKPVEISKPDIVVQSRQKQKTFENVSAIESHHKQRQEHDTNTVGSSRRPRNKNFVDDSITCSETSIIEKEVEVREQTFNSETNILNMEVELAKVNEDTRTVVDLSLKFEDDISSEKINGNPEAPRRDLYKSDNSSSNPNDSEVNSPTELASLEGLCCFRCHSVFKSRPSLHFHMKYHCKLRRGSNLWPCSVCQEKFTCQKDRQLHMETHRNLPCRDCHKLFFNKRNLREHRAACTLRSPARQYVCELCGASFVRNSNLRDHLRKVHAPRPSECQVCGKQLKNAKCLKVHMKTHLPERECYKCDVCNKEFITKAYYIKHFQVHQKHKLWQLTGTACGVVSNQAAIVEFSVYMTMCPLLNYYYQPLLVILHC